MLPHVSPFMCEFPFSGFQLTKTSTSSQRLPLAHEDFHQLTTTSLTFWSKKELATTNHILVVVNFIHRLGTSDKHETAAGRS
ncbi:hypothetical protein TNCV_2560941 [Trichonephila clavipes]|uniref:Uncharacterized protein n=1 Tax=Trichonephila clavipes TaxID=2585209 RepID=A0A8X6R5I6_TRICX|nr:hypothetical protein TNCV_2560941 [Trichonephila clavipes]